jgi:hypothetical protein
MDGSRQYTTALALLAAGAVIEQVSEAPITYRLKVGGQSVPLPGGVVQQLITHKRIRQSCRVSGKLLYVAT